ncbi:hypothetical protein PROFUN_01449 [Planoprotostelium fungivorum]|uniref:Uncharacterized protein n=1 Tax=Planoprotostelium fungivorum TaxID=1890364 RepID=A0A2P6NT90_9EUKA|nr:hypothetical protein PROFUN_01449 [Planoprotostelium fungivorum]
MTGPPSVGEHENWCRSAPGWERSFGDIMWSYPSPHMFVIHRYTRKSQESHYWSLILVLLVALQFV